ncbi:MAG TPA: glycosyltransferase family 4 protein [Candidatus Poseidoniaceae archaeon]|nr:glycosyltransferase family 4 protein [Candidatus Poseidoniaceae archaeon]
MNLIWVTVRSINDFCSTTTTALSSGLVEAGHDLILLNADTEDSHIGQKWSHVCLKQSSRKGMKASSLASSALKWFRNNKPNHIDVVIVDWPLAPRLAPTLNALGYRIILMDRSPPADVSLFGKLQWRVWKKAWKMVTTGIIGRGCVVSEKHSRFVQEQFSIEQKFLHVIPAGVDLDLFSPLKQPVKFDGLRLIYHGRLDKHRGILSLPMLVQKLISRGFKAQLTLVGDGNAVPSLRSIQRNSPWLDLRGRMSRPEIASILSEHHIGLLPMPETKVWSLASPLKRSEYLASGLLVLGIDHSGHVLENTNSDWFHLVPQPEFHSSGVQWLSNLDQDLLDSGSREARKYSIEHFSWDNSIYVFIEALHSCKNDE